MEEKNGSYGNYFASRTILGQIFFKKYMLTSKEIEHHEDMRLAKFFLQFHSNEHIEFTICTKFY